MATKATDVHSTEQHVAAASHIATLSSEAQSFAKRYWAWLSKGQVGLQPVADADRLSIQHSLNQIHHTEYAAAGE